MQKTKIDMGKIQTIIQPLIGNKVWQPRVGVGSFLLMEFGKSIPRTEVVKPNPRRPENIYERGEWGLWIYMCQWRIEHRGTIIASSQSETKSEIKEAIVNFEGRSIESVDIKTSLWDTDFVFSDSYSIKTFSMGLDSRCWSLRTPSGKHIIAGPGESWEYNEINA